MSAGSTIVTRFAPSPTGYLHLGHAMSALFAQKATGEAGRFLLRIEDIDQARCREEFITAALEDLSWLGLRWEQPIRRQSQHFPDYANALALLRDKGLLYPCFCTRADIAREIAASNSAPHGPEGALYPGICRHLSENERRERIAAGQAYALRLDVGMAAAQAGPLLWHDYGRGMQSAKPEIMGDVVLARKDIPTSYHLAVVVDDAIQGITLVTRGEDLFLASHLHRLLQALLNLPTPDYHHHPLLRDEQGQRLAKRKNAPSIRSMRESGFTMSDILPMVGFE